MRSRTLLSCCISSDGHVGAVQDASGSNLLNARGDERSILGRTLVDYVADALLRPPGSVHRQQPHRTLPARLGRWPEQLDVFRQRPRGRIAAVLRSFAASCERVKVDPLAWFCDVLTRIAAHPITKLEELLPHRWAQARA